MTFHDLPYLINPSLRLSSPYLQVRWHVVEPELLRHEALFATPERQVYAVKGKCEVLCEASEGLPCLYSIYYTPLTDFNRLRIQQWLRRQLRDFIVRAAERALPARLHELERQKNLYCKRVTVRKLRKNVLGQCSRSQEITLSPKLVLFPRHMSDAVILHEMAHLRHMHHRKSFWQFLSVLLGEDATAEKVKSDLAYCERQGMIEFLLK